MTTSLDRRETRFRVDVELQQEIEQFLYLEAELLDDRCFEDWLELFADDIHYWMPVRANRLRRELERETAGPGEAALFDEDKDSLFRRVGRLQTGMAWAEDPPSRTRHLVTNVRISPTDDDERAGSEFEVRSNFLVYRNRLERDVDTFAGTRTDILRRVSSDAGWQIARRTILLDQSVLLAKNLSIFF